MESDNEFELANVDLDYHRDIRQRLERIETRADLADFIFLLAQGYQDGNFEKQSVSDYLDGAAALTESMHNWYRNIKIEEDPNQPTWKMFGRVLFSGFYHS